MRTLFLLLAFLAAPCLTACGGGHTEVVEDCICDDFGCDCVTYEEDVYYYKSGDPAYENTW